MENTVFSVSLFTAAYTLGSWS